jgi:hypothetical protein
MCSILWCTAAAMCSVFSGNVLSCLSFARNSVFLKGALWSLFIPVLFVGKMKFFYENKIGVMLFFWWTEICMNHIWICWLYVCGIFVCAILLLGRRRKLRKLVAGMEKRKIDDTFVYVTDAPVSPFTIGVFKPQIVIPKIILEEYDKKEFQTILLHEKVLIRMDSYC